MKIRKMILSLSCLLGLAAFAAADVGVPVTFSLEEYGDQIRCRVRGMADEDVGKLNLFQTMDKYRHNPNIAATCCYAYSKEINGCGTYSTKEGYRPQHVAALLELNQLLDIFVNKIGLDPDVWPVYGGVSGYTPLMLMASKNKRVQADILISGGAKIEKLNGKEKNAPIIAREFNHLELANHLESLLGKKLALNPNLTKDAYKNLTVESIKEGLANLDKGVYDDKTGAMKLGISGFSNYLKQTGNRS